MNVLINLIVVIISPCICISNIRLYTLNIYNFICQLCFNKAEAKKEYEIWFLLKENNFITILNSEEVQTKYMHLNFALCVTFSN